MNEIVNDFLLAGDKFIKQPRLIYSAYGPFTKTKKEYKNLKKHEIQNIFIKMN